MNQMIADQFSQQSITSMVIIALLCTAIPFLFLGYYKSRTKTKTKISSFFIGMAFYIAFAFFGEQLFHILILGGLSLSGFLTPTNHPVYYAVYGAVVAGIFQETGKYIGLKKCMNSRQGRENAFLFGFGHGSFETIAYGSSLTMGNIVIAFLVNSFGIDGYFEKLGITGEDAVAQTEAIQQLIAIPPSDHIAAGIERLLALVFQASLAIFIYLAIQHKELKHLFPIAIVLHIICYLPANLTNVGILNNTMISLCLTGTVVVFTAAYAYRMYHQLEKS